MRKPEYAHLQPEENKEIYISSAWYKNDWIWDSFRSFKNSMIEGKSYFVCALPYQLSVEHRLLSEQRVNQLMSEDSFNEIGWYMEYEAMFFGESENAFYKLADIQACRTLIKPVYPLSDVDYLEQKGRRKKSDLQKGEIRIIACDVAMMGGDNDLTVFTYIRLIPDGSGYIRYVPYIETMSGQHSQVQAIRLKQLFYELECSAVVLDTQGKYIAHFMRNHRDFYRSIKQGTLFQNRQLESKLRFNSLNRRRA